MYNLSAMLTVCQRLCGLCRKHANLHIAVRSMCNAAGLREDVYTLDVRQAVEETWKPRLKEHDVKKVTRQPGQEKYYVLSMFPYPSGKLHMGHVRVYTISDAMARYHRLKGQYVLHPMGWDAFGLPAENAAIERGERADVWTKKNITSMKAQMEDLCLSFNWNDGFATCDAEYYKWTQFLFLKMYEKGLVYQKMGQVNWDPVDQTVLADEQIDEEGRSWRSGAQVEKRYLKQWYIKTTAYTKSLVDGLSEVKSDLWKDVIDVQRNWLGTCDGIKLEFTVQQGDKTLPDVLSMFTHNPECIYGASHILLSNGHYFNDKQYYKEHSSDCDPKGFTQLDIAAVSPITGKILPIVVDNNWTTVESVDSHLGIPSVDVNDLTLAHALSLQYKDVLEDSNTLKNSEELSGLNCSEAFTVISKKAKELGCGGDITSKTARDWLISRQRYWGTPIPIIHCPNKGAVPVPYEDLPVKLPILTTLTGKGQSPLSAAESWLKVKCPGCDCDGYGLRETDTMDTFVDSSWYFLRYLDSKNTKEPFSLKTAHENMPVDLYIGGKEHTTMHLYYARFLSHFLYDMGMVPQREPFHNLLTQGLVKGLSYYVERTNKFLRPDEIDLSSDPPVEKTTGEPVEMKWFKMSKSKHNGVDPQDILDEYGCDATRLGILSNVAPKSDRLWDTEVFKGVQKWQSRIWLLVRKVQQERKANSGIIAQQDLDEFIPEVTEFRNYFVNQVNHHMEKTFLLSVAISRLHGLTNALVKCPPQKLANTAECERALGDLIIMLAPFCPLFSMELWENYRNIPQHVYNGFKWDQSLWEQHWPEVDKDYRISMKVKVNGKSILSIPLSVPLDEIALISKKQAKSIALNHPDMNQHLDVNNVKHCELQIDAGARIEINFKTAKKQKHKKLKSHSVESDQH